MPKAYAGRKNPGQGLDKILPRLISKPVPPVAVSESDMTDPLSREDIESGSGVKEEVREPRKFKVLLHNDDYTTMEFVVQVLMTVFHKNEADATTIMLAVHNNGMGVCGVFTAEVAETKVVMVRQMARKAGYPLKSTMEEE